MRVVSIDLISVYASNNYDDIFGTKICEMILETPLSTYGCSPSGARLMHPAEFLLYSNIHLNLAYDLSDRVRKDLQDFKCKK